MSTPERLSERHRLVAEYELAGLTPPEIATKLDYAYQTVWAIRQSPLYQVLLTERRKERDARTTFDMAKEISGLAKEVFDRKRYLMNQDENLPVANAAAESFMDRILPKRTQHEVDVTAHVRISLEERDRIDATMREIDVTPSAPVGLKSLATAIAEADAAPKVQEDGEAA